MANKIDILVVEPCEAPRPIQVEDTLEAFQQIVGVPIEAGFYLPQRVMLICNGGELVNGGILEQAQFWVRDAAAGDDLYIYLDSFSRTGHLLVRLWRISFFLLLLWEHSQFAHNAKQALRPAGIAALLQAVPQLHQADLWIAAAHIPNQLQLRFGMLVWMAVRTPGLASQRCHTPIPAGTPKVNI